MKISSIILLLLYCVMMFATLFVKNDKLKLTKLLAILGIGVAIAHTVCFFVAQSHWAVLLTSLVLFMSYGIVNGLILKKTHILHWIIRFIVSALIFVLFVI